jgi:hypothetical protein
MTARFSLNPDERRAAIDRAYSSKNMEETGGRIRLTGELEKQDATPAC